ncbi:MAG TPA: glycosyltransferase [Cyclobacteriaceae bacterium]|nr:glycosyltransferase [Cyclobacteriaceae bacterium]
MSDTGLPMHIVHLSYTKGRPAYHDPVTWLARVAFASGVTEQMTRHATQTVIYNIHYKGDITRNGVRYLFPAFKRWQLVLPFEFNRYIKKLKPDVVIIHGLIFPWQVIMLRWIMGPSLKIVCQHHAERPFTDFRAFIFRLADRYVGAYLFASKEQGDLWVKARQISSPSKIHEIIGTSSIFRPADRNAARSVTGVTARTVYLWIGDLNKNKDPLLTARAFAKFAGNRADVGLYMIYQSNDLEHELKQVASGTSCISLIGRVDHKDLLHWFNSADYFISSSFYEGSGIAVIEALSCGCIPILTNIPSFVKMTNGGTIGRLFEAGDENGLRVALEDTFGIDREAESKHVLKYFEAELSFEANARKIIAVVNALRP